MTLSIILIIAMAAVLARRIYRLACLRRRAQSARHWASVEGEVIDARVEPIEGFAWRWRKKGGLYFAKYHVNGLEYGTSRTSLHPSQRFVDIVLVKKLKIGKPVKLYYDPDSPCNAILYAPEKHSLTSDVLGCAGVFAALVALIYMAIR